MTLFIISFVAGVLTVLSPCILPLLPVIVGGTAEGGTSLRRALTVTLALGASVFLFTFLLKVSTLFISVPQWFWMWFSGILIIALGLATLFPSLFDRLGFLAALNRNANKTMSAGYMKKSLWGDIVVGAALGPVFSTCSPTYFVVLATVLPVSLTLGIADILAYILGLCGALLLISVVGQKIVDKLNLAADPSGWFKRALGILFVIIGILIITGYDKVVEAPLYSFFDVTTLEQGLLQQQDAMLTPGTASSTEAMATTTASVGAPSSSALAQKYAQYHMAPELVAPDAYLNTDEKPITIGQFRGKKVVLIDFWTYSCINCQRTMPYLVSWNAKYKDEGLVIIGVHTPEFGFEKVKQNVADALKKFGITYPVVLDNEYQTWNAFGNHYWPRKYLIDIDGFIVYDHAGEGNYDETETAIQKALKERAERLGQGANTVSTDMTGEIAGTGIAEVGSPETYFGSARNEFLANGTPGESGEKAFVLPAQTEENMLYLGGSWDVAAEDATTAGNETSIEFTYDARDIYFVASADPAVSIDVYRDGKPVGTFAGADVSAATSKAVIKEDRLYKLIHDATPGMHTLKLLIHGKGLHAYTFTFG